MKSMQEMLAEQAADRLSSLKPSQVEAIQNALETSARYESGEITLQEAEYQTIGSYYRFKVTQTLSPSSRYWRSWMKLINDLCATEKSGYMTNHGFISKSHLDLGSGRVRIREKTDFINGTIHNIIEFQYVDEDGRWQWPTEKPVTLQPITSRKNRDESSTKKQWQAWEFPEDPGL